MNPQVEGTVVRKVFNNSNFDISWPDKHKVCPDNAAKTRIVRRGGLCVRPVMRQNESGRKI